MPRKCHFHSIRCIALRVCKLRTQARSIQPKFQSVRPGKVVHLKRWTSFFETFPVGPNRSIEFWTEISGNFGWMHRARDFGFSCSVNHFSEGGVNANHNVTCLLSLAENDSESSRIAKEIAMVSGFFVKGRRQTLLYSCKWQEWERS